MSDVTNAITPAEKALIAAARKYVEERADWVIGNKNSKMNTDADNFDMLAFKHSGTALGDAINNLAREMKLAIG